MKRHKLSITRTGDGWCGHQYCTGNHNFDYFAECDSCDFRKQIFGSESSDRDAELRLLDIEHNQNFIIENIEPKRYEKISSPYDLSKRTQK